MTFALCSFPPSIPRPPVSPPLWTGLLVFGGFLAFVPEVPYWLDAPEIIAAAWNLGQVHPPGHPAMLMVLKAFLLIPVGDAAFRANLFSAVFGAVSAGLVCRITQVATDLVLSHRAGSERDRFGPPPPSSPRSDGFTHPPLLPIPGLAGTAAGLGFGWSLSSVIQSLSVEVYSLNVALVLAALALALHGAPGRGEGGGERAMRWRVAGPIALLLALGLGNHHLLTVLAVPALAVALWPGRGSRTPALAACGAVLIVATGLTVACLWARGSAGAWPAWADTSSLDGVWWVASARLFSESLGGFDDPVSGIAGNLGKALALLATNFSPVGVVLAAGGLYLCVRSGRVRTAVALALLIAGSLASKVSMGILDPHNPDDHGYFLGAVAGVAILQGLFGAGLIGLAARVPRSGPGVARGWGGGGRAGPIALGTLGAAVLASTALVPPAMSLPVAVERAALRDPVEVSRMVWEEQPPRSVLFLSHYPLYFQAMHGQVVEGTRPDVTLVQSSLYRKARGGRFYAERLRREDPDLGGLVEGFLRDGTMSAPEVARLAARRPVRFDAEDEPVMPGLDFAGWTLEVVQEAARGGGAAHEITARVEDHVRGLRRSVPWPSSAGRVGGPDRTRTLDIETRRVLIRHLASMARTLAALGHRRAAARLVETALELNPLDRRLRALSEDLAEQRKPD